MSKKTKILSVRVERAVDQDPDLSYLGEYSQTPKEGAIDRQERGEMSRCEYRYWNPSCHLPHNPKNWSHVEDSQVVLALQSLPADQQHKAVAAINYPARYDRLAAIRFLDECYVEQDYLRCEAACNGHWEMIGIIAKAEVQLSGSDVIQTIRSGGLWGIPSDSGEDYIQGVEKEELLQLANELRSVGCTERQINLAMKTRI